MDSRVKHLINFGYLLVFSLKQSSGATGKLPDWNSTFRAVFGLFHCPILRILSLELQLNKQ